MASFSRVVAVVALAVVVALVVVAPAALVSATCTTSADCSDAAPFCGSSFGGPLECLTCQESAPSSNGRHNFCNSRSTQTPFCNVNGACAPCTSVTSATACQATYGQPDCLPDGTCGCAPKCDGKVCGDDGCGGVCGTCTGAQEVCSTDQTQCQCVAECTGKVCGDDGCGGSCGSCTGAQEQCNTSQTACECVPDCTGGNVCGADGCGGVCGTCANGGSCNAGDTCDCVNGWVGDLCDGIPTDCAPKAGFFMYQGNAYHKGAGCDTNTYPCTQLVIDTVTYDYYLVGTTASIGAVALREPCWPPHSNQGVPIASG